MSSNVTPQRRASFKDHLCISTPNERISTTPTPTPSSPSGRSAHDDRMTRSMYDSSVPPDSPQKHSGRLLARQSLSFSFSAASDASLATNHTALDEPLEAGFYTAAAAVHPSYQNMMDDQQLIDSCTAAQRDIAALRSTSASPPDVAAPLNASTASTASTLMAVGPSSRMRYNSGGSSSTVTGALQNAQRLRQWIGYMHKYLDAIAPKRAEVLRMSTFERRVRLAEQSELRKYIASYDRTVKRAAQAEMTTATAVGGGDLEERYLALLLQAIEAQCLLEGYPGMRRVAAATTMAGGRADESGDDDGDFGDVTVVERQQEDGADGSEAEDELMVTVECGADDDDDDNDDNIDDNDDAVSSDFSYEPADRPQTNLRDEILAIVATPDEVDTCCGAAQEQDYRDDDGDDDGNEDNDRTLISSNLEPVTNAASVESASAKLTKNMVNRWLQLNLQPPVRWRRPPSLERRAHSRSVGAEASPSVSIAITEPKPVQNQCETDRQLLNTTLSSTTTSSSSPKTDDPVWDGFLQEFQPFEHKAADRREANAQEPTTRKRFDYFEDLESAAIALDGADNVPDLFALNVAPIDVHDLDFQAADTDADDAASLSDSFLLSGPTRRLTMSTLKRIDDIFEVQHATPHRVQWVERRRSSATTAELAAQRASCIEVDAAVVDAPTSAVISPRRSPSGRSHSPRTGSNASSTSPSAQQIAAALLQLEETMRTAQTPPPGAAEAIAAQEKQQRSHRKRRRRNRRAPKASTDEAFAAPLLDKGATNYTLHDVLVNNIGAMQPDEVRAIVRLCQAHLECLNHVLLCRTVNAIVGQAAMDGEGGGCELRLMADEAAAQCRCGPIARIVQAMVDFVRDYVNVVRNWRLYRIVVAAVAELYGMAKFVGERVRWHRAQMVKPVAAIEFVL